MMATSPKNVDRRAERTRQIIRQGFVEIVREKGLDGVSVKAVAERANISRGTFYTHYADKYELVDAIVREEFQRVMSDLPETAIWSQSTLQTLVLTLLEYFKSTYQHHRRSRELAPILDKAIREELDHRIFAMLSQAQNRDARLRVSLEALAGTLSWTIFGAAVQWSQERSGLPAEIVAEDIARMILDGIAYS